MRRRRLVAEVGMPPQLAEFDPADWWVPDLEDPLAVAYGRIAWWCARRAYAAGGDWESHLEPPTWWTPQNPQTRSRGEREHVSGGQTAGEGIARHPPRTLRARPIKSR